MDLANFVDKGAFSTALVNATCGEVEVISAAGSTTDAEAQAACQAAAAECTATTSTADAGTQTCTPPDSTCTATVGELETCLNDLSSALAKAGSTAPSCATLTVAQVNAALAAFAMDAGAAEGLTEPASCTSFDAKCPGMNVTPQGM